MEQTGEKGLTEEEVLKRHKEFGLNIIHKRKINFLTICFRQFTSNPLIIILAAATFISYSLGQHISSYYIFALIIASIVLGFWNEYASEKTVDELLKKISHNAVVIRDNEKKEIAVVQLTIGDIVLLFPGSIVPADVRLFETTGLEVDESALTGESATVHKTEKSTAFMGTHISSGFGKGIVFKIGKNTEFGKIAKSTVFVKPTTDFQKGLTQFGGLIMKVILVLTLAIFIINAILGHRLIDSVLFALAIAVGLTPELLPVIVTVSLSHGAGKLAKKRVLAKQLISIENLGNMDILCTDKTGTLTEGKLEVIDCMNPQGRKDDSVLVLSLLCNSAIVHHRVLGDAIDVALWEHAIKHKVALEKSTKKIEEEPFDYTRRMMFSIISENNKRKLLVKGSPESVLNNCKTSEKEKETLHKAFVMFSKDGYRVIALATRQIAEKKHYTFEDVKDLTFAGYITFLDTPKKTATEALDLLKRLNVVTKVVTGDNEIIAQTICREVGMKIEGVLTGEQIAGMVDEKFESVVEKTTIFARVNPEQKLKIIQVLQKIGHAVGYLGDGINDIPALRAADVGISVDSAIDVAKDAASVVLMQKSLRVIADGIMEGRKTFSNTIKYILMATSSNFGNMFSAAGASFFLDFLPMTPVQILLTNGLYDISQMSIPSDNVDSESLVRPRHWNIDFIKNYMLFFGPLSSLFDFATFGVLLFVFHAKGTFFQTGWFIESVATEILVVFVIRTSRTPFFFSRPGKWLLVTCLSIVAIGILIPFSPLAAHLEFLAPPPLYFGILVILISGYLFLVEAVKTLFLKYYKL